MVVEQTSRGERQFDIFSRLLNDRMRARLQATREDAAHGYASPQEFAADLELIRRSLEQHRERLLAAGFSKVVPWFQCLNFASLIALP